MSVRAKTILIVLVAITLVGVGYFFIINKPASLVLPSVNTALPPTEEIDTSNWQTYRNEKLGFEIKMPKEWVKSGEDIGQQPFLEDEFWQEQIGGATFIHSYEKGFPQFNVRVKDSDLSLEEFLGDSWTVSMINDLPAKIKILDYRNDIPKRRSYSEFVLIKNNNRYYYFRFSASIENINQDALVWKEILKTFKPIP